MDATPTRTHTKETITLRLIGHEGLRYGRCPVTFGVPFADGASRRGAAVRLVDENGSPIPTQTQCLATWDRELEYVKRLLVDAQVDLGEGWARDLTLEYPADAPPPEPEQQVCVKEEGEYLRVDTGAMRLWIRRTFHQWQLPRRPDVFARRSFHWLLRTVPEPGQLPNSVFTRGERGDEAVVQPPCLPEVAWGNKYHVYEPALRLFPSETFKGFLVHEADCRVWQSLQDMLNYQCTTVCFAYDLTGDVSYAAYAKDLIESNLHTFAQGVRDEEHVDFQALWDSGYIPRLMRTVAQAWEEAPQGFEAAVDAWREKRQRMPDREPEVRPDQGPEMELGRLSTTPHP